MAVTTTTKDKGDGAHGGALMQAYVDLIDAGNPQAQLILNVLTRFLDWETGVGYPNYETLATLAKCSRKTVQRFIVRMEEENLLWRTKRFDTDGNGRRTSNELTLVGYAEWFKAVSEGGVVAKPRKVGRRRPYGQTVHRGEAQKTASDNDTPMDNVSIAPLDNVSIASGQQLSTPSGQQVSILDPSLDHSLGSISPPPPRGRGVRAHSLLDEVFRAKPHCGRAFEKLFVPLLTRVPLKAPNPEHSLGMLAEFAERQSDDVLHEALRLLGTPGLKTYREHDVRPPNIETAIAEARKLVSGREAREQGPLLFRGTRAYEDALAKVAAMSPGWAEALRGKDFIKRSDLKSYGVEQVP